MSSLSSNSFTAHKSININTKFSADFAPRRRISFPRTPTKRFLLHRYKLMEFRGQGVVVNATSAEDGVVVNGVSTQGNGGGSEVEEMRVKLNESLESGDVNGGLVQAIHDAARAVELAVVERGSMSRSSWFAKNWLGVDKNAWVKTLSYQAAVYSLLHAAIEISSRGEARDRDINVSVERSLLRLCSPLEGVIRDQLSSKNPAINEWFWSHQQPKVMSTYMIMFESDHSFNAATSLCWKGEPLDSGTTSDLSLLMLSLSCLAAITKLGSAKVSCSQFFSMVPEITGRLMDMLLDYIPIKEAYKLMEDIGLRREFLMHFGPRASANSLGNNYGGDEIEFWVALVQKQLQRAIDREKIWSRLTTCESIEVLEKDLAIFGFFIALGRSSQSFLSSNGLNVINEPLEGFIRYLIGGSVLFYPQLSSISSYQLYVEVVCEELDWLPFYPSDISSAVVTNMVNEEEMQGEFISLVANVCSYWMTSFIKYSTWLQNPSNIKAARFLSRGHSMLNECMEELGMLKEKRKKKVHQVSHNPPTVQTGLQSFDEALESVEGALNRLESLLQELHISNANNGKQQLQAACSDLERIRKLKKEAEFLEASFRAKAASLREVGIDSDQGKVDEVRKVSDEDIVDSQVDRQPRGFWSFLVQNSTRRSEPGSSTADQTVSTEKSDKQVAVTNDISRFELLRNELIELEKRVQRSTDDSQIEEEADDIEVKSKRAPSGKPLILVQEPKKDNVIAKSMEKIKETTTDVLQGTQLLATDVSAAMVLLKRSISGDELTEKEKKALRRTLTDLASVIPIGFLMLLPVTAVGHAAMLAFIQRYVPALIPSTYAPERLDLLRQLEKVKQMEDLQDSDVIKAVGPKKI